MDWKRQRGGSSQENIDRFPHVVGRTPWGQALLWRRLLWVSGCGFRSLLQLVLYV